jgi:hypothetical protein
MSRLIQTTTKTEQRDKRFILNIKGFEDVGMLLKLSIVGI